LRSWGAVEQAYRKHTAEMPNDVDGASAEVSIIGERTFIEIFREELVADDGCLVLPDMSKRQ
jgi:hypothetical protein